MTKSVASSKNTGSSVDTESSRSSDELFDLDRDTPTTEDDIRVLRELRRPVTQEFAPHIDDVLDPRHIEGVPPRRTTSEGWEPFELD